MDTHAASTIQKVYRGKRARQQVQRRREEACVVKPEQYNERMARARALKPQARPPPPSPLKDPLAVQRAFLNDETAGMTLGGSAKTEGKVATL